MTTYTTFLFFFFFFNDTATTEIYTLSLHDALPSFGVAHHWHQQTGIGLRCHPEDRKSTRLNSSHLVISYAVFCLKKKKNNNNYNPHKIIEPTLQNETTTVESS